MADILNNLKQKFNKSQGVKGQAKTQRKNDKKQLVDVLKTAFANATSGGMAQINHDGNMFLLTKIKPPLQQINHDGAPHLLIPMTMNKELADYQASYQKLLQTMQKLNYEQKSRDEFGSDEQHTKHVEIMERNEDLFGELDEMTFEFSEGFGKKPGERKKILNKFDKIFEDNPVLNTIASGKVQK